MHPKTKIVCTIGPSSHSQKIISSMIEGGMSVARLNFSHGTHSDHAAMCQLIRDESKKQGRAVAILQDLCGPKIRVGKLPENGIQLASGQTVVLTCDTLDLQADHIPVSYTDLPSQVKVGDRILLADGMMELVVDKTTEKHICCKVITGGLLTSHKGINLPSSTLSVPAITEKDKRDLLFGLEMGIDFVALSFVRSAADIHAIKRIIHQQNKQTPVIAKFEKHEAIKQLDAILEAADGVMVARGDLGVEIALENVPNIQKKVIRKANELGKPVIIATQMLRSMVDSPRPTRAEAADVATAVMDGADAIMLSEETASGQYPVESVKFMARIALSAETEYPYNKYLRAPLKQESAGAVAYAACVLAKQLNSQAIVATTRSGSTAFEIAKFRPRQPIIALTPDNASARSLMLHWGCRPCLMAIMEDTDAMVQKAAEITLEKGHARKGDTLVITAGRPIWEKGTTNLLWVKTI
ncbi:MAG: pyruvate kinase [Desulfobacteraceae bacterium]|nr:pyruvate kinase [Desulfobacteraceae bacterium]